ncbi:MAG: hypothetical protein ABIP17_10950 [Ilumatobacteraceae bacterium]
MNDHTDSHTAYVDHKLLDEHDHEVGTISDVIYGTSSDRPADDQADRTPTWLVVNPGLLRAAHYVPAGGSYRTDNGDVVVPWSTEWIKSAPKAESDHVVTDDLLAELTEHYGSAPAS